MKRAALVALALATIGAVTLFARGPRTHSDYGRFVGDVVGIWLPDGRDMKLQFDFAYIDPLERKWDAPRGSIVNGADIPMEFWSIAGGPFEGKYRKASVLHDVACQVKKRNSSGGLYFLY
jgi:hypothetical protein